MLAISHCPYRLLFKHPFATSHGVRDGTDSVFVRIEEQGLVGYGEVTLPPYVKEKPEQVIARLRGTELQALTSSEDLGRLLRDRQAFGAQEQGLRTALHTAFIDLLGHKEQKPVRQLLDIKHSKSIIPLVTIGVTPASEIPEKLRELPASKALKIKIQGLGSLAMLEKIKQLDDRPLFLDANQGLDSLEEAMILIHAAGERLLAMEQPFAVGRDDLQQELQRRIPTCIYGDESIQGVADLERVAGRFGGVNIKLMKCGGLDRAVAMIDRAEALNMKVMLGSMSESSLGCTAMAHLAGRANIADLDGPWLIKNDPFVGLRMQRGDLVMPGGPGIGAALRAELPFVHICA